MFSNWKPKLETFGGLIAFVITLLGFLGVTAKEVREFMTTHYLWLLGAIASFALFGWGCYTWWRSARVTVENARAKIRNWLDLFSTDHGVVTERFEDWNWGLRVPLVRGPLLFIAHTSSRPDSILFRCRITLLTPDLRAMFDGLSQPEKSRLYYMLRLSASRSQFFFSSDEKMDQVSFDHWIQIRALTHSTFIDAVNQTYFSANILWSTASIELGGRPLPTLPASTPGTETSPPSPT